MKHTKQLFLLGIIISFLATELHGQELSLISNVGLITLKWYHFLLKPFRNNKVLLRDKLLQWRD